jgi:hypothetical protein
MKTISSIRIPFALLVATAALQAQSVITLGSAASFGVLGATTVTNTGPTVITGDLGVSPGTAITGFPPGIVLLGGIFAAEAVAAQAQLDAGTAYGVLAGETPTQDLSGQDLGGLTLTTGVYFFSSSAALTGTLILDAGGDPDARFDFLMGSTLTTATGSLIQLVNGAQASNVFWQVGSSATLGTNSSIAGTILANQSITANTGATFVGGLFALNGAVTLDTNTIQAVPESNALPFLAAAGALGLAGARRRHRALSV